MTIINEDYEATEERLDKIVAEWLNKEKEKEKYVSTSKVSETKLPEVP